MNLTNEQVAVAFSGHEFDEVYPYLSDDVTWTLAGERVLDGKNAVIDACNETAAYLRHAQTKFSKFRTIVGTDSVVIDSRAAYTDSSGETSFVASCDIYDFRDGLIIQITSYNVALEESTDGAAGHSMTA